MSRAKKSIILLLTCLLLLSVPAPGQATPTVGLTAAGRWVGWFDFGDGPAFLMANLLAGEKNLTGYFDIRENGQSDLTVGQIEPALPHIEFTLQRESGALTFSGKLEGDLLTGTVTRGERQGELWLTRRTTLEVADFDPLIGNYQLESGQVIMLGRGDRTWQDYYYTDGSRIVSIYPVGDHAFVSELSERLAMVLDRSGKATALFIEPYGEPARLAKRVPLYREERVQFQSGPLTLAGSILLPPEPGPHPAVVFTHGSDPHEREMLRVWANPLVRNGIAVLIYDKRGSGESEGDWTTADFPDLTADALAAFRLLRSHPDIKPDQVGLWGASQGAWVVAEAARQEPEVAFLIAVSAAGMSPQEQGAWAMANTLRKSGVAERLVDVAYKGYQLFADTGRLARAGGLTVGNYFVAKDTALDSASLWEQVSQPTLFIYGGKDPLVPPESSARLLSQALERAGNRNYRVDIHPEGNHGILLEGVRPLTFAPGFFDSMVNWVQHQTRGIPAVRPAAAQAPGLSSDTYQPMQLDSPAWYERAAVQLILMALVLVAFLSASLGWSVRFLVRRMRRQPDQLPAELRRARPVAGLVSGLNLLVLLGQLAAAFVLVSSNLISLPPLYAGRPVFWMVIVVLALGSTAATLMLPVYALRIWRAESWSLAGKLHYTLVALTAVLFVPYMAYWHLLGW